MKEFVSRSVEETEAIAGEVATRLQAGSVLALYGDLGAGKTAFVRGLVKALCPECLPLVHSPTFAIVNEYRGEQVTVYHFDLYRLKDEDDLYSTGFFECLTGEGIVVTEWSENFPEVFPEGTLRLKLEALPNGERRLTLC
ncbi:MAG: tRNA (adenosine(37)-N6)-threonylcarbamoyltransferase complex ATPase subunit type 1 TsaE [Oscillospiraceae bacterium]|nr:tRNA (adenosine(37)-N6)-threonylcarbamoyltransferase complex ATPase subunit type 1 TsaE [Oscillospiraceae bacterium]